MWSEAEIQQALFNWRAASAALERSASPDPDHTFSRGLAAGYVRALEMVLRPREDASSSAGGESGV